MAEHPWQHLVVGGVSNPRFLNCGIELCSNPSFETNVLGWLVSTGNISITKTLSSLTYYGDYVGRIAGYMNAGNYIYYVYNAETSLAGAQFVVTLWAKGTATSDSITVYLNEHPGGASLNSIGERTIPVKITDLSTTIWSFVLIEGTVSGGSSTEAIEVRIQPFDADSDPVGDPAIVYAIDIDGVTVREVSNDDTFQIPTTMTHSFEKELKAEVKRQNGTRRESILGWRPNCEMEFEYLSATNEGLRRQISQYPNCLFFPHNDVNWGYFTNWAEKLETEYFHDKYVGHSGTIELTGVSLFSNRPDEVLAAIAGGAGGFAPDIFIG